MRLRAGNVLLNALAVAFLALLGSAVLVPGQLALAVESVLGPEIDIGVEARSIVVDPGLNRVYVAHSAGIVVIDSLTRVKLGDITGLRGKPFKLATNPNTH